MQPLAPMPQKERKEKKEEGYSHGFFIPYYF
jgi:hypothetical protein